MRKMYRLHGFEERLRLVLQVKSGCPISVLSRIHRLDHKMLLEWVRKYDRYGEAGLIDPPSRRISPEIKEEAVRLILEKSIPLPLVALDLDISRSTLKLCVKQVKLHGYEILYQQMYRGKSSSSMKRSKKPSTKSVSSSLPELERLQTENAYLRAENALLKKVKALVEEQEARRRAGGRKPSKD